MSRRGQPANRPLITRLSSMAALVAALCVAPVAAHADSGAALARAAGKIKPRAERLSIQSKTDPQRGAKGAAAEKMAVLERGRASWYGPGFHGRKTANGERFDMNELTAAHKTLPFGTRVLVRNPSTGKEVAVRINDRGPFAKGRIIDLSRAAAKELGVLGHGHVAVELHSMDRRSTRSASPRRGTTPSERDGRGALLEAGDHRSTRDAGEG